MPSLEDWVRVKQNAAAAGAPPEDMLEIDRHIAGLQGTAGLYAKLQSLPADHPDRKELERKIQAATRGDMEADRARQVEDLGGSSRFAMGLRRGLVNTTDNVRDITGSIAGLASPGLESAIVGHSRERLNDNKDLDKALLDSRGGFWGNLAGEALATAPLGMAGGEAVGALKTVAPIATKAHPILTGILGGAATGAPSGALLAGPNDRASGAVGGGLVGGGLGGLGAGVSQIVKAGVSKLPTSAQSVLQRYFGTGAQAPSGVEPIPEAQDLADQGVQLSLNQMAPRSDVGRLMGAGKSLPGVGPEVQAAEEAGKQSWRNAAMTHGLPPGQVLAEGDPHAQIGAMRKAFSGMYSSIGDAELPHPNVAIDDLADQLPKTIKEAFNTGNAGTEDVARVSKLVRSEMSKFAIAPKDVSKAMGEQMGELAPSEGEELYKKLLASGYPDGTAKAVLKQKGLSLAAPASTAPEAEAGSALILKPDMPGLKAQHLMDLRSSLREARDLASNEEDYGRARLLHKLQGNVTDVLRDHAPANVVKALDPIDAAYSKFATLREAVRMGGAQGEFLPSRLNQVVRGETPGGVFASGEGGPLQDLAKAGQKVFEGPAETGARMVTLRAPTMARLPVLKGITEPLADLSRDQKIHEMALHPERFIDAPGTAARFKAAQFARPRVLARALAGTYAGNTQE